MNWIKENPFLTGLIGVTVVAAGALGFLLSQAMSRYQEASDGYDQAVEKLHGLEARVPFPNQENLAKSKAVTEHYRQDFQALQKQLADMDAPVDPKIGPQQFQDDLRTAVNEITTKAQENNVTLPANFYLGFGQYASNLPSEQAAPHLSRELSLVKTLVQQLIDLKVRSIDALDRRPLPQEASAAPAATPAQQPQRPGGPRNGRAASAEPASAEPFERDTIDLSFTAEQSKFRVAFNSLLNAKQFYIVRAIELQNSQLAGPPVEPSAAPAATPANGSEPTPEAEAPKTLNVILGQELVKATLRIEILHFDTTPTPPAK